MTFADDIKFNAAAKINPQHHKAIPQSDNAPAPWIGQKWTNDNGDQTKKRAGESVAYNKN